MQSLNPEKTKKRGTRETKRHKFNISETTFMRLQAYKVDTYKRESKFLKTPEDIINYLLDNATK